MGRFAVIPVVTLNNENITDAEKLLLILISGLSGKSGFCYATNEYLALERKCSVRTVQRQIKKLEKLNLLRIDMAKGGFQRRIFVCVDSMVDFSEDPLEGDTDVMGGDTGVAKTGVSSDKIINNINKYKEKEINKEKESRNEDKVFIELPLKDGETFEVSEEYVQELIKLYPKKAVREELKIMQGWLMDKPEKERKTRRGINRFIRSWLSRARELSEIPAKLPPSDETLEYLDKIEKSIEEGEKGYLAFKAKREAMQGGMP